MTDIDKLIEELSKVCTCSIKGPCSGGYMVYSCEADEHFDRGMLPLLLEEIKRLKALNNAQYKMNKELLEEMEDDGEAYADDVQKQSVKLLKLESKLQSTTQALEEMKKALRYIENKAYYPADRWAGNVAQEALSKHKEVGGE